MVNREHSRVVYKIIKQETFAGLGLAYDCDHRVAVLVRKRFQVFDCSRVNTVLLPFGSYEGEAVMRVSVDHFITKLTI